MVSPSIGKSSPCDSDMALSNDDQIKEIIVIGAGVVGLTTALKIQEQGTYRVTIVAENFPTDPKSIRYTSHWAVSGYLTRHVQVYG